MDHQQLEGILLIHHETHYEWNLRLEELNFAIEVQMYLGINQEKNQHISTLAFHKYMEPHLILLVN